MSTTVKLGCPMLTKKIYHITAVTMWQESNISKNSQRTVLRYLSNFFGTRLVVPVYCIDKLGQNHVIPQCDFLFLIVKRCNFIKPYFQNFNYILAVIMVKEIFDLFASLD